MPELIVVLFHELVKLGDSFVEFLVGFLVDALSKDTLLKIGGSPLYFLNLMSMGLECLDLSFRCLLSWTFDNTFYLFRHCFLQQR